jgi:hypothetical protein
MRNVFRFLFGNWFARSYLLLVAFVAVLVFVVLEVGVTRPISQAFGWILVTLPGSLLASPGRRSGVGPAQHGDLLLRAGGQRQINAAVISLVAQAVRRRGRGRA